MRPIKNCKRTFQLILALPFLLFMKVTNVSSQSFEHLKHMEGYKTNTYYSIGSKEQAETMATRCDNVISFYKPLIDFEPTVTLLVLSLDDWSKYTDLPVYGMPHYDDTQTLIVASEDNGFWKSFIPSFDKLPSELSQQILNTYADKNNSLTMRGFFDLLAIHELGHAFHSQGGLSMQRKWMGEFFANIFLHVYIAEKEPELLPALTLFPKMVVSSTNIEELNFTTLSELESNYNLIGQQYPKNYGWYQCRWHVAAGTIYDAGGITAFNNLWQALKNHKELLDDTEFSKLLAEKVHKSVAEVQLMWDK